MRDCSEAGCTNPPASGSLYCALPHKIEAHVIAANDPALGPTLYHWTPTTSGFECLFMFGMYGQVVFDGSTQEYKWGVFGLDNCALASGTMPSVDSAQRAASTWSRSDELRRKVGAPVFGNVGP